MVVKFTLKQIRQNLPSSIFAALQYIKDLLEKEDCDILLLQETWLLESNLCPLNSLHSGFQCVCKSGVENNTKMLVGRPPG